MMVIAVSQHSRAEEKSKGMGKSREEAFLREVV